MDILFVTLTFGCKNKKQASGLIELDLEAGNLVYTLFISFYLKAPFYLFIICFMLRSHKTNNA